MGIPAIPEYLKTASATNPDIPPGHRFNLLFPVWNSQFNIDKVGKKNALDSVLTLGASAEKAAAALRARQKQCLTDAALVIEAVAIAPLVTGVGLKHPLENGFAFLNPYGIAYLPGSSVKGVLRQAAHELIDGNNSHWSEEKIYPLDASEGLPKYSMFDVLFGLESGDGDTEHFRGVLSFHDAIPEIAGNRLSVEVMTPHQSHYYQNSESLTTCLETCGAQPHQSHYYQNSESPHDSGKPTPIFFLAVPPKSKFTFYVCCDTQRLNRIAPQLLDTWQADLTNAFEHAFDWLGFGAKTAVGYGAMMEDATAKIAREAAQALKQQSLATAKREKELGEMSADDRAWALNEPIIGAFTLAFTNAKTKAYQPGSAFDQTRLDFATAASQWTDAKSREAAGVALWATLTKAWGMPSNKERKTQLQDIAQALSPKPAA